MNSEYTSVWGPIAPELLLCVVGLLILAFDLVLPREKKIILMWTSLAGLAAALAASVMVLSNLGMTHEGAKLPKWLGATLCVDEFAMTFKILVILATMLTVIASPDYAKKRFTSGIGEYYALLVFAALGMALMVGAVDFIGIYIAMEFTSITSYVLVGYMKRQAKAAEAGIKYYLIGVISSAVMLYGMSLIYGYTGTTDLSRIGAAMTQGPGEPIVILALVLILVGLGFKLAAAPFHMWAPEAYEGGPTPFVGLLSVGPKVAGLAILLRLLEVAFPDLRLNWTALIAGLAALSMILGNLAAIPQTNIKRMLAYSSVGQIGYILIGVAATSIPGNDWRMSGIYLYLLTYLFMNIGAFTVVTAVSNAIQSDEIEDYTGMMQWSPFSTVALLVFLASLAGLPPTAGLWGKALLFGAAISSGMTWLAVIGVACSVVSVFYYFNVARVMFFAKTSSLRPIKVPGLLILALIIALIGTLGIGLYPEPFIQMARGGAEMFAAGGGIR